MITAALSLVVFYPRAETGSAWAQTLAATMEAPNVHTISHWANGNVGMEEWRSGLRRATLLHTDDGQVQMESRSDGRRNLIFFDWQKGVKREDLAPNARRTAIVGKDWSPGRPFYEIPLGGVEIALNDPDVKVVGHEEAKGDRPEIYHLQHTIRLGGKPWGEPRDITAEIDPKSRRIRALVEPPSRFKGRIETHRTEIDYPASIAASIFEPRVQVGKVDETYDIAVENAAAQRTLRNGLGKRGPVTLRAAFLDGDGELWAYWTGAPATKIFSTPGVPLQVGGHRNAYPSGLTGLGRTPKVKIGSTVDLDIPYPGGVARFRKAPIRHIEMINHVQGVLMAFRKPL